MIIEVKYTLILTDEQLKRIGDWARKTQGIKKVSRGVLKQFLKRFGTEGLVCAKT